MRASALSQACAAFVIGTLTVPSSLVAQEVGHSHPEEKESVEIAPASSPDVARRVIRVEDSPLLTHEQKLELLRRKVKYVFVLFQENRSFDFYFGTYPGARGLFSQTNTLGFNQPIILQNGRTGEHLPVQDPANRY